MNHKCALDLVESLDGDDDGLKRLSKSHSSSNVQSTANVENSRTFSRAKNYLLKRPTMRTLFHMLTF